MKYEIPEKLKSLNNVFKSHGYSLYLVGGAVRDFVLEKKNDDYDFTTDAEPSEIKTMFKHTIDTGIKHGTVTVLFKNESYEITTFRTEGDYKDKRHPEKINFVKNLEEDLKRRDFTINALSANLDSGEILDYHNGLRDLKNGVIRAIGDPEERFTEDALRMLRACRFSAKLGFDIEENTFSAMKKLHKNVLSVSAERIREELFKLIQSDWARKGLEAMRLSLIMKDVLPELERCYGIQQNGYHNEDVYEHQILALEYANRMKYPLEVRIASLLHDIGKPDTKREGAERFTFYGHDLLSSRLADGILTRLKASNKERYDVAHLIKNHMFSYTPDWTDAAIRRFINRVGIDYIERLFMLRSADVAATTGSFAENTNLMNEFKDRIKREINSRNCKSLKDLAINGNDLISIGIKGKPVGKTLNYLLDKVIENPSLNNRNDLLNLARSLSQGQA